MPASVFAVLCIDGKGKKRKSGKVVHRSAASDDLARTNVKILQDIFRRIPAASRMMNSCTLNPKQSGN
ncbi:MAG: hypothetical protein LBT89_04220 [Planctomycetaceae bacterium]|jgi:hypothetical protein|nr:hypothetical protein [Planctomycetaceae bacterium]